MSVVKVPDAGGDELKLLEVDGHLYPPSSVDVIRGIRDLPIRDDDVFVCAYPKCGTHWVWEMARLLLSSDIEAVIEKDELMLEFIGNDVIEKFPSPRILNTHCLVEQLPRGVFEKKCKIIYIIRNPKDMAVSFYHHHKKLPFYEYNGKWENYFPLLMDGKVDFGSFFTYLKDWAAVGTTHPELPTLTLVYEDLKEDPLPGIRKLAKFLNCEKSEEYYLKVKELTSFKKMKAAKGTIIQATDGASVMYRKGYGKGRVVTNGRMPCSKQESLVGVDRLVFRVNWPQQLWVGEVGDWKNHFTVAQNELFDRTYKEKMAGCDMKFRYTV